ncbi:MAG: hypothetical protein AAF725_03955, partial [Acidobacteriota bacterium]
MCRQAQRRDVRQLSARSTFTLSAATLTAALAALALTAASASAQSCPAPATPLEAEFVSVEAPTTVRAFATDPVRVKVKVRNPGSAAWPVGFASCDVRLAVSDELPPFAAGTFQPWSDSNIWRNAFGAPQYVQRIPEGPDLGPNETHTFELDVYPCGGFDDPVDPRPCPDRRPLSFQMVY